MHRSNWFTGNTTLAAFINCMLETQCRHVLTIEDPIEFIFEHSENSIIHQRKSKEILILFNCPQSRLREDPDVIYIGEMRDLETIQLAITAAETGHLVLGTLHTSSASKTRKNCWCISCRSTRQIVQFQPHSRYNVSNTLQKHKKKIISLWIDS